MASSREKMVRTTVTIPLALKKKIAENNVNLSKLVRDFLANPLDDEESTNMTEAVLLNEKVRRSAPKGWDSTRVIKEWRKKNLS